MLVSLGESGHFSSALFGGCRGRIYWSPPVCRFLGMKGTGLSLGLLSVHSLDPDGRRLLVNVFCFRFSLPLTPCWTPGMALVTGSWTTSMTMASGSPGRNTKRREGSTSRSTVLPTSASPSTCQSRLHGPQKPRRQAEARGPAEEVLASRHDRGHGGQCDRTVPARCVWPESAGDVGLQDGFLLGRTVKGHWELPFETYSSYGGFCTEETR